MKIRSKAKHVVVLLTLVSSYLLARQSEPLAQARANLAQDLHFTQLRLREPRGFVGKKVRKVHPSLSKISAWISSVGAAVAVNDFDGDGLSNDVCLVDPRFDTVTIAPVPGTGKRFESFLLVAGEGGREPGTTAPMGCAPIDANEDGRLDAVVYYWGRTPVLFENTGSGFQPRELVAGTERWFTNAATFADLDGDGHADLIVANYFKDGARILDSRDPIGDAQTMQDSMSRAQNSGQKHVFLWSWKTDSAPYHQVRSFEGDAVFGWALAIGAQDLDGDSLPELYVANDFGSDQLFHNRSRPGHLSFAEVHGRRSLAVPGSKVLGRDSFKGMGVDFGDVDGDGLTDIVVSNIATYYGLLESHFAFINTGERSTWAEGIAPYVDRSEELGLSRSGWGWDVKLGDFDNDGQAEIVQALGFIRGEVNRWPELQELAMANDLLLQHVAAWPRFQPGDDLSGHTPNAFFKRSGERFVNIPQEVGLGDPHVTRGIAVADVDGDGDLDFVTASQWDASFLNRNDGPSRGQHLNVSLRLPVQPVAKTKVSSGWPGKTPASRAAIGASVELSLPNGRRLIGQVDGGNGHSGRRSQELHFGLGAISPADPLQLAIQFRGLDGKVRRQRFELTAGDYTLLLGDE